MMLYAAIKRNRPQLYANIVLPAIYFRCYVGRGTSELFYYDGEAWLRDQSIIATGPGIVATLCGAVFFKEIRGVKNFLILGTAVAACVAGGVMVSLARLA